MHSDPRTSVRGVSGGHRRDSLGLFNTDATIEAEQYAVLRDARREYPDDPEMRRFHLESHRELREHARWRQFSFLLFVAPALVSLISIVAVWFFARTILRGG